MRVIELAHESADVAAESDVKTDAVDVSFFIPCFNEQDNVANAITKVKQAASQLGLSFEILVFDDCSRDHTVDTVRAYQQAYPEITLRLFVNEINRGVSRNFVEGAFQASGTYYRLVCGDDIEPIETHVQILQSAGHADIIIPYFTEIGGRPTHRHLISKFYTFLVNLASGNNLRYYNGCPLYRKSDVQRFHVEATGFGYQAEFLTRLLHEGYSYIEVPLISIDREGSSSVTLRGFVSVGHSLLKIALRRLRVYLFK
jgi:glycosyltransferase involved in cell wall biosynthesis